MKCIQNPASGEVKRVSDTEASRLARYGWRYISKTEFKAKVVENNQELRWLLNKAAEHAANNQPVRRR